MGAVSSRPEEGALYLRDQSRGTSSTIIHAPAPITLSLTPQNPVAIASLTILNAKKRVIYNVVPNAFPTSRVTASREAGDDTIVDYVQVYLLCPDRSRLRTLMLMRMKSGPGIKPFQSVAVVPLTYQ